MIEQNDQIKKETTAFGALVQLANDYLSELRMMANSKECLPTIGRVEKIIEWAEERMEEQIQRSVAECAMAIGFAHGHTTRVLGDEELLADFVSRGGSKKDFLELSEALKKVAATFYNSPRPA